MLLGVAGVGGLAGLGWWWLRRREIEIRLSDRAEQAYFREVLSALESDTTSADYWAEMRRPATVPVPRTDSDGGLTRRFDPLFARRGRFLPIPYLRALAHGESGLNPSDPKGLINVVAVALDDYNRRQKTRIRPEEMRIPETNVRVAADTLRTIIASYRRNHPDVPNLRENWSNPAFVELLTLGWNAGYSEASGVGKVVQYLTARGQKHITAADIHQHAQAAGATRWLSSEPIASEKLRWSQGVARRFYAENERDRAEARRRHVASSAADAGAPAEEA